MFANGLSHLIKSLQVEASNFKTTPGSILLGSLSFIGFLTVINFKISFLNLLFSFSPLSKPFKISLDRLRVNLLSKDHARRNHSIGSESSSHQKHPSSSSSSTINNSKNISSSWAIITGPTNGIGKEFAIELAKRGFNLFLIGRNLEKLQSLETEILQNYNPNIDIEIGTIDLSKNLGDQRSDDSSIAPIEHQTQTNDWKKVLETLNRISTKSNISILINNAGLSHSKPTEFHMNDLDKDINSIINVNVLSVLYLTKLVVPFMLRYKSGLILNVGSFSALVPTPFLSTYAGSKGFLYTWSQALGTELEPQGVDVRLLNTYFIASEMSKIKKTSFLIPSPNGYVRQVLSNLISTNSKPFIITGYFSHSLLEFFIDHFGTLKFWLNYNLRLQRSIIQRFNRKKNLQKVQ